MSAGLMLAQAPCRFASKEAMRRHGLIAAVFLAAGALVSGNAPAQSITYDYDALGRLISVSYDDGTTVSYSYDDAGNRTAQTVGGSGTSASRAVVVLPIAGFIVLPIKDSSCGLLACS